LDCVDDVFERIASNPEAYGVSYHSVRRALVRRFPYVVCFLVESECVFVIAVFHGRQDPRGWRSRV
jgi:plasmid stabilization system protein ParE